MNTTLHYNLLDIARSTYVTIEALFTGVKYARPDGDDHGRSKAARGKRKGPIGNVHESGQLRTKRKFRPKLDD